MSEYVGKISEGLRSIYVAPPGLRGIAGWEFSLLNRRSLRLESEITDYVTENGGRVQDHISLSPVILELSGFVGESLERAPREIRYQREVESRLTRLADFLPELSVQAQASFNGLLEAKRNAEDLVQRLDNSLGFLGDLEDSLAGDSNIGKASRILMACWQQKIPLVVKTDFSDFENIHIQSLEFAQASDERYKSDITITLKQITTTSRQRTTLAATRLFSQKSTAVNYGEAGKNSSTLHKIIN
jgi:hypothetical protein